MNPKCVVLLMYAKKQGLRGNVFYKWTCCMQRLCSHALKILLFSLYFALNIMAYFKFIDYLTLFRYSLVPYYLPIIMNLFFLLCDSICHTTMCIEISFIAYLFSDIEAEKVIMLEK